MRLYHLAERRKAHRYEITLPCTINIKDQEYEGFTKNISLDSLLISLNEHPREKLQDATRCRITIYTELGYMELAATINRIQQNDQLKIAFRECSDSLFHALHELLDRYGLNQSFENPALPDNEYVEAILN